MNFHHPVQDPQPCSFDPQILPHLILQEQQAKEKQQNPPYQLIDAGQEDWEKVEALYNTSKVAGYDIAKIEVIVNETFSQGFFSALELLEQRSQRSAFTPTWIQESIHDDEKKMREQTHDHLLHLAQTPQKFSRVKVVLMFHGTKQDLLDNIFCGSFAALSTTDEGFFGKGIYHSSSAQYAHKYAKYNPPTKPPREGALLLNWVCFSSAYPVIHHPQVTDDQHWTSLSDSDPLKKKHWKYLSGRPGAIEGKYDAHYVLVSPKNSRNSAHEMEYYPHKKGVIPTYNECITFETNHVLPRYLITLTPDLANIASIRPKCPTFTTSNMKQCLVQLTQRYRTGQLARVLQYRLETLQEERTLTQEELIELGHLLYLDQSNPKSESAQWLIDKITFEKVRNQTSRLIEPSQPLPFPDFLEQIGQVEILPPIKSPDNPLIPIQTAIQERKTHVAINELLFLLSTDVDPSIGYQYLVTLLPQMEILEPLFTRLPTLFQRLPHHQQAQCLQLLSDWYQKRKAYPQSLYCHSKAQEITSEDHTHRAAPFFFQTIFPHLKQRIQSPSFLEQTADEYLNTLQNMTRFCSTKEETNSLYLSAKESLNQIPLPQQPQYRSHQEKIFSQQPHPSEPIIRKYQKAFQSYLEHFSKENSRTFQQGIQTFKAFFDVLLQDALLILGPPPSDYDIRAIGHLAREEVLPSPDLQFIILLPKMDAYFNTVKQILETQFLSLGKRSQWSLVDSNNDLSINLLRSTTLARSTPALFIQYQQSCEQLPRSNPQFHYSSLFSIPTTPKELQKTYTQPLTQLIEDFALYHHIPHTNSLDIMDALTTKEIFTKDTAILIKEILADLYSLTLYLYTNKPLQPQQIDILQRCHHLIFCPLSSKQPYKNLPSIARTEGHIANYQIAKLHQTIQQLLIPTPTPIKVTGPISGYLDPKVKIFDKENNIRRDCSNAAHNVCPFQGLHFKQKPSHPLMEYAIYSLYSRCAGFLTPPIELVRFDTPTKSYPVLISQTITGKIPLPDPNQNLDLPQWTRILLCSILTRPGDGRHSNFILHNQKIYSIDNDISFVEPVVSGTFKVKVSRKVQFCSAPFFMKPLETPLDPQVLEEFSQLDRSFILDAWIQDIIQKEKQFSSLFSEKELEKLYNENPNQTFTPTILFKEGTLATLDLQFWQLQNLVKQNKNLTAGHLLQSLISLEEESVGSYIHRSYRKSRSLQEALNSKERSLTSIEYSKASLGRIPTHTEIQQKKSYSAEKARDEFFSSLLIRCSDSTGIVIRSEKTTLSADFQHLQTDPNREVLVLKALAHQAQALKPSKITIHHSTQLNSGLLNPFLYPQLASLSLDNCTTIDKAALTLIHQKCSQLEVLSLKGCSALTEINGSFFSPTLSFPKLHHLEVSHCRKLTTLQLDTPVLQSLNAKHNPQLQKMELTSIDAKVNCADSPRVRLDHKTTVLGFGLNSWEKHFGDIGQPPPLPPDIHQILSSPCPFWPNKKVQDTHMLVLIPTSVNGKPLTMASLGDLVEAPKQGNASKYRHLDLGEYKDLLVHKSYWVLMTRDVLEGTRDKTDLEQSKIVAGFRQQTGVPYEVPRLIEATVCLFMIHASTGTRLYGDSPWTCTRCQEAYDAKWQLVAGGFVAAGLSVGGSNDGISNVGVGCARKF